jgi:hypothetical protein
LLYKIEQIDFGIKAIINAYETKCAMYEEDLQKLLAENNKKDKQIKELSKLNDNHNKIMEQLQIKYEEAIEENKYLNDYLKNVKKEMKGLEEFKSSIVDSIKTNEFKGSFKGIVAAAESGSANDSGYLISKTLRNKKRSFANEISIEKSNIIKPDVHTNFTNLYKNKLIKDNDKFSFSDKRIDNLIDKLNESINQKIYSQNDEIENGKDYCNELITKTKQYELSTPIKKKSHKSSKYSYESNTNIEDGDSKGEKSKQYVLSSKFFNECRVVLKGDEYIKLIDVLKQYNSNKAGKDITFKKIEEILRNHNRLLKDFKEIFQTK